MSDVNFNSRISKYAQANKITEDEAKKKLEQEEAVEKLEKEIEPGSYGTELGEENLKLLEQAGLLSKYQTSAKTEKLEVEGLPEGLEITVDKSTANANITCKYDPDTKTLTISGTKCVVNINGSAESYDINVNLNGNSMTLNSNATVASIKNSGIKSVINGSDGNDNITSTSIDATINAGKGNDTIIASGINTTIRGGEGNDTITANGINTNIFAGEGDDTIKTSGINVFVDGGAGSDTINGNGINVTLDGGASSTASSSDSNSGVSATSGKTDKDTIILNNTVQTTKTDSELQQESLQAFKDANSKLDLEDATFTYDKNNKVISYTKDGVTVSISYDSDGNLLNGKNSDGKLCQNGLLFSGYNTKDGVMYSAGEVLNGLGENGLMYENGLLCDNSITTTTDNETIISTYEMGKLVSKSVDKFDANGAKVQNTSETYDKYDRITEKVVTYYENGEISHSVSTSDYVYPDNYTSTPTSYAEVNPDGTFTVSNLTLDKNGDIVSCTKTDENDVAKFYTLQNGELQPANGTIDGVTYVDGVVQKASADINNMTVEDFYALLDSDNDGEIVADDVINLYNTTTDANLKAILAYFTDGKEVTAAFKLACSGVTYDSYESGNKGITNGTDDPDMIAKNGIISKDSLDRLTELAENPSTEGVKELLETNRTFDDVTNMTVEDFYALLDSDNDGEIVADDVINLYNTTTDSNLKAILAYFTDGKEVTAAFKLACSGVTYDSYETWNKGITNGTDDPDMIAKNGIISKDSLDRLTELAENPSTEGVEKLLETNRTPDISELAVYGEAVTEGLKAAGLSEDTINELLKNIDVENLGIAVDYDENGTVTCVKFVDAEGNKIGHMNMNGTEKDNNEATLYGNEANNNITKVFQFNDNKEIETIFDSEGFYYKKTLENGSTVYDLGTFVRTNNYGISEVPANCAYVQIDYDTEGNANCIILIDKDGNRLGHMYLKDQVDENGNVADDAKANTLVLYDTAANQPAKVVNSVYGEAVTEGLKAAGLSEDTINELLKNIDVKNLGIAVDYDENGTVTCVKFVDAEGNKIGHMNLNGTEKDNNEATLYGNEANNNITKVFKLNDNKEIETIFDSEGFYYKKTLENGSTVSDLGTFVRTNNYGISEVPANCAYVQIDYDTEGNANAIILLDESGKLIFQKLFDKNNKEIGQKFYDENGIITKALTATEWNSDGTAKAYAVSYFTYENGKLVSEKIFDKNNKEIGQKFYDENGNITKASTATEWNSDGTAKAYAVSSFTYENGKLVSEKIFDKNNKEIGQKFYDENGNIAHESTVTAWDSQGVATSWTVHYTLSDGSVDEVYENGELVSKKKNSK